MTYHLRHSNRLRPLTTLDWLHDGLTRARDQAPRPRRDWRPPFTLHESEQAFEVQFSLPGADPSQLEVQIEGAVLRVSGARPGTPDDAHRRLTHERSTGTFARTLEFSAPVDAEHVEARYTDGILRVTLPKAAEARTHHIEIRYDENEE